MEHQDPVNLVDISHLKRIKGTRFFTPLAMSLIKTDKSNTIIHSPFDNEEDDMVLEKGKQFMGMGGNESEIEGLENM
jgi:hypothetical protein